MIKCVRILNLEKEASRILNKDMEMSKHPIKKPIRKK